MAKKKKNKDKKEVAVKDEGFSLKDYAIINLIFLGFLLIISLVVFFSTGGKWDPVMKNVFVFIFLVFGGGFLFVSVFDFIYEKVAGGNE